jgi:aspartate kinase
MDQYRGAPLKVAKFGGTSLADGAQITKVCGIVKADPQRRIVVVSAPGKRHPADPKVTDLLIALAERGLARQPAEAELGRVLDRFASIRRELGLSADGLGSLEADLRRRLGADASHRGRYLDTLKAAGEDHCAQLVAEFLRLQGVEAVYVSPREAGLVLSSEYGNAQVLPESYGRLAALSAERRVVVFPGFFGYTRDGDVVTFPRGGSDITGAILAAAVRADLYENFTDVDSVFAADPALVPGARAIELLTYREMRELAYAGFRVFHDEAIVPAVRAGIPICVRNTNRPEAPGTMVVPRRPYHGGEVVGIASAEGFCAVYVDKYLMNREIGFGRRLLQIIEEEGLSYEHAPSGIDNMSLILRERDFSADAEHRILARIRAELGADNIEVDRGLALVMIVGEGMHYTVGVAARATGALASAGVNIEMLNQGSSEISMMFGVKAADRKRAVVALYDAFFRPPVR